MPFTKAPYHWIVPVLTIAGAALVSYLLFVWGAYYLPVLPMIFAAAVGAAPALLDRRRGALSRVRALEQEREHILARLHSREERVAALERELASSGQGASPERVQALLDEVEKTREEIRSLSSRADDMTPFAPGGTGGAGAADEFEGLVFARGGPLRRVVDFIRRIAPSDAPVMILGESGTGKELVARAIHRLSPRAVGPFVPVNCGALAENLLESELFGHERGAFTGAVRERAGRFETADGGTIFLDEIAETSEGFQVKLLRVLQEGEFERVGGSSTVRVNVRVLAATNRDIRSAVREGRFREDLYYRLNVLTVSLPPLRDRPDDIFHLAQRFVEREGGHLSLSTNVMGALRLHSWPGNVRELESTLRRAVLLASSEGRNIVSLKDLPEEIASASRLAIPLEAQIMESVRRKGFSRRAVSETAEELGGLNRGTVAEYLRGEFLTAFLDGQFDAEKAVTAMAQSPDPGVHTRVQKRLLEYLENLTGGIDRGGPWESVSLRPKLKNLPQRYHASAETIAEAYHRRQWDHPANRTGSSPGIP
jgi:transcriptional regulator with GAF, ATPase, and Fis domain